MPLRQLLRVLRIGLLNRYGINSTAGEYFNDPVPHVRIAYGGDKTVAEELGKRLAKAAQECRKGN